MDVKSNLHTCNIVIVYQTVAKRESRELLQNMDQLFGCLTSDRAVDASVVLSFDDHEIIHEPPTLEV